MSDWWEVVSAGDLAQGDVLRSCPVYRVKYVVADGAEEVAVTEEIIDVVVLTQTCDLENDKVDEILVAGVLGYSDLATRDGVRNPAIKGKEFRKKAVDGNLPAYFLLPERTEQPLIDWSLVDFHNLFSMPKAFAERFVADAGARLRLVPPYREHLAQAFARYIMRVGLPTTLDAFERVAP